MRAENHVYDCEHDVIARADLCTIDLH